MVEYINDVFYMALGINPRRMANRTNSLAAGINFPEASYFPNITLPTSTKRIPPYAGTLDPNVGTQTEQFLIWTLAI